MLWNSSYSVGIENIDEQHKAIFKTVNNLKDAIGRSDAGDLIGQTLVDLVNYSKVHFSDEEKFMREIGFPELNNHILLHKKFKVEIIAMLNQVSTDDSLSVRQLYAFSVNWLKQHVIIEDKKIGIFVRAKNKKLVSK